MAGISGQPAPKPSQLAAAQGKAPSFDEFTAGGDVPSFDSFVASGTPAPAEAPAAAPAAEGGGMIQTAADYAPAVGGFAGGIVGGLAGGVGAVPGAVLGGAGGYSLKRLIEINLLGKEENNTYQQDLGGVALTGIKEGAEQLAGGLVFKGLAKGAKIISGVARAPYEAMKKIAGEVMESIEKPVLEMLANKGTKLTNEQSGDTVKTLLTDNIKAKYGGFIDAYKGIDDVAKAIPFSDASRYKFTERLKSEALDKLGGDDLRVVRKFAEDINRVENGAQIDSIMRQVADAKRAAQQTGATNRMKVLGELEEKIDGFLEDNTLKLAAKMKAGKATPQEMQFIEQSMAQRGIIEPDAGKYAKSIASDFLKDREKVRIDYAGFREFLSDVGEQTGVSASKRGPMRFLSDLDSVPSEKLIEKMFDPKNARALRSMRDEVPEVFDQVRRARVRQIAQTANPDGNLDLKALAREVGKPKYDSTRGFLFDPGEIKMLQKTINSPELARVDRLNRVAESFMSRWGEQLGTIAEETTVRAGKVATERPGAAAAVKQATGKAAMGLSTMMTPRDEQ